MAVKLTNMTYKEACKCLEELNEMKEDLERAKRAGNPHVAQVEQRYEYCRQRIEAIKREYFPNRK